MPPHSADVQVKMSNCDAEVRDLFEERDRCPPNACTDNEMEILTERQRQIQSRKPLYREYSSVFPIMQKCKATQWKDELRWRRRGWREVVVR